jgi:hypothetical protein
LFYVIIFFITSLTSLFGSLNTIFVKRNQSLFRDFIKMQNYVIILIIFIMALLYFSVINYLSYLFIKAFILIFLTFYLTYRIKYEVRNNNA